MSSYAQCIFIYDKFSSAYKFRFQNFLNLGSIFHIKKSMKYSGHRKLLCELSKLSKFTTSSDTKRTLMHLFLFTNSAHRELVSICTQSIRYSAINFPCITTLELRRLSLHSFLFGIEHIFS